MRTVTSNYLTASHLPYRVSSIRAEYGDSLTTVQISRQDIEQGSVTIDESAIPSNTFDIGSANISTMGISLRITDTNKWENITNGIIKLYYKIKLANNTYEEIKLGTFLIPQSGIKKTPYKVELQLISKMSLFDKSTEAITTSGTPYQLLIWACEQCGMTLVMTQAQIEAMPNGLYSFAIIEDSSCETFRDVVMWVAHLLCGFAATDSDGNLVIRSFVSEPVYTISKNVIESHTLGDVNLDIENVIMKSGDFLFNIDPLITPEKTITLDENMLFRGNTVESMLREYITNLKNKIEQISYMPFSLTFNGDPCIELGDVLTLWDSGYVGLVTEISWNYNGMCTLSGANFTNINSKSQSTSSRTSSTGGGTTDVMKTSRYENIADIIIAQTEKELFSFNFSIGADTVPKVTATYVLEVLTAGLFTITLEYDNIVLALKPKFTAPVGFYSGTIALALPPSQAEGNHFFVATILSDIGSATIQEYNVQAYVEGMNLDTGSSEFNGRLAFTDVFTPIVLNTDTKFTIKQITDIQDVDAKAQDNLDVYNDIFVGISLDSSSNFTLKTITESVSTTT